MQWLQDTLAALTTDEATAVAENKKNDESVAPVKLQDTGQLSKEQLREFFCKASEVMKSQDFRRKLKDAHFLKQDVEDMVTDMQKGVLESQGIEGTFGIEFLGQVSTIYKADNAIMAELLKFASLEEDTLDEVEMSKADYEQKQRLLALAKAHTADLMNKMDALPPDERQAFLRSQLEIAEQLRGNIAAGNAKTTGTGSLKAPEAPQEQSLNSMSPQEMLHFFKKQRS